MDLDDLMESGGGFGALGEAKEDVVLLKDEAVEITREIKELQRLAASLMERQERVVGAIGRLKDLVGA